mmetsp:Transcript_11877/g.30325  ORF Transcript_11877/g.30325 Transcript_11877/m.30325 type:complete len:230 (+) Transcript_11877:250-939(+)
MAKSASDAPAREAANGDGGESTGHEPLKPVNKGDIATIKHVLDNIFVEVVSDAEYPEDFSVTNLRMFLSVITCLIAAASHAPSLLLSEESLGRPVNFETDLAPVIWLCLGLYALGQASLIVLAYYVEKDNILFTKHRKGTFSGCGLRVATRMDRYCDQYNVEIGPNTNKFAGIFGVKEAEGSTKSETREFKKSITKWIDVDGNIAEDIVRKDMSKFVEAFETSQYKKSK